MDDGPADMEPLAAARGVMGRHEEHATHAKRLDVCLWSVWRHNCFSQGQHVGGVGTMIGGHMTEQGQATEMNPRILGTPQQVLRYILCKYISVKLIV